MPRWSGCAPFCAFNRDLGRAAECTPRIRRVACGASRDSPASRVQLSRGIQPTMSLAVVLSRGLAGLDAPLVTVEVHLAGGLPAFNLVGLPDTEVRESRDRVRAALQNA